MKLVHAWAQEFVTMPKPEHVREVLDAAGLSVESIDSGVNLPTTVVVGSVLTCDKHPHADHLKVTTVEVKKGDVRTVVCGAPNVATGQKVPVALPGTKLPNGMTIKKASIRGVASSGMICAEDELGLGTGHSGIIVLPAGTPVGVPLSSVLGGKDIVYDVSVTPNRADCLSVLGLAREIAAGESKKLKLPRPKPGAKGKSPLMVRIKAKECCYYSAQVLENVRVKPSPDWMIRRLQAAGIRPINNVVDITNYVMLELGTPLHAFDARTVAKQTIIVRKGKAGEQFPALDERTYGLRPDHLVIADPEKAIAIAGVMGGQRTGIAPQTSTVILEAALFDAASIYTTSRQLKLVSESSQRFAKGVDPLAIPLAMARARELFITLCGAKPKGRCAVAGMLKKKSAPIAVSAKQANKLLGTSLSTLQIKKVLTRLQFGVKGVGDRLSVIPPTFRSDVVVWEDVAEEIARLHGYNAIPTTLPKAPGTANNLPPLTALIRALARQLACCGAYEHVGYAYVPADHVTDRQSAVRILNPLSRDQEYLRTSLLPGLFSVVAKNAKRSPSFRLYEFGSEYRTKGHGYEERPVLALVWHTPQPLRDLKGALELVFHRSGIEVAMVAQSEMKASLVVHGQLVGKIILPTSDMTRQFKITNVAAAVINLETLCAMPPKRAAVRFHPLSQFPDVKRDIAFWVPGAVRYAEIEKVLRGTDPLLVDSELFDIFTKDRRTSYALHLTIRANNRTLTSQEADAVVSKLSQRLQEQLHATVRTAEHHV